MSESTGLLAVWMKIPPGLDDEFTSWYNDEHVPERMAIPGFLSTRRYVTQTSEPRFMALYDLTDPGVMQSEAYMKIRTNPTPWTRRIGGKLVENIRNEYELVQSIGQASPQPSPYALLVRIETAPEHDAELNSWYEQDHLGALQSVPGCYRARRFRATAGSPRYLAVYDLESAAVTTSPAWRKAADSEWTLRMRPKFQNTTGDVGKLILAR